MEPQTLNAMNDSLYRAVLMLIEDIALIAGLAFVLCILVCLVSAICGWFAQMMRPARKPLNSAQALPVPPKPDAQDVLAALAALNDGFDNRLPGSPLRRKAVSIRQA